ncbi:GNAT family N-acetyltransferase [Changpingibacter yushuensis]|uniref:GNAT family N-acetyltransferase n=1 Tax=Changpingibacter yushuensis TaxID=2758440 RepID=UPI0015F46030|nr:GNAT family N-acetyltransferase [Changpingibacter yushuensis]
MADLGIFNENADVFEIETQRLTLRGWEEADLSAWIEMNADPEVRSFFPSVLSEEESLEQAVRNQRYLAENGFGLWAVAARQPIHYSDDDVLLPGDFLGFIGIHPMDPVVPETGHGVVSFEIGWRLRKEAWHQGLATEGATAARDYAFGIERLPILGSLAVSQNTPSIAVMERIGFTFEMDVEDPELPDNLQHCVLYTMTRQQWTHKRPSEE